MFLTRSGLLLNILFSMKKHALHPLNTGGLQTRSILRTSHYGNLSFLFFLFSLRMGKLTTKYPSEFKPRKKSSHSSNKIKLSQESDRLLEEFLTAREELKTQFEKEKREIVSNYERRNKYLRNLLEEYSEKIDMLKLNLEGEKVENKILKEKVSDMENNIEKVKENFARNGTNFKAVLFYDNCKNNVDIKELDKTENKITYLLPESSDFDSKSDITSICKHSDSKSDITSISKQFGSTTSVAKYFASNTDISSIKTERTTPLLPPMTYIGIHQTCREEFGRLLDEIRLQKVKHEEQLDAQKRNMKIGFERERLQIEQCVFKQLNSKLEKEFKRRELLVNERECLHHCLSKTIVEATMHHSKKLLPFDNTWAETNSDSGADVGDNRSDDDADSAPRDDRSEKSTNTCSNFINDILCNTVIGDILREQKNRLTNEFHDKFQQEKKKFSQMTSTLNSNIASLVNENDWLKKQLLTNGSFIEDVTNFQGDMKQNLVALKYLLDDDPYAC